MTKLSTSPGRRKTFRTISYPLIKITVLPRSAFPMTHPCQLDSPRALPEPHLAAPSQASHLSVPLTSDSRVLPTWTRHRRSQSATCRNFKLRRETLQEVTMADLSKAPRPSRATWAPDAGTHREQLPKRLPGDILAGMHRVLHLESTR